MTGRRRGGMRMLSGLLVLLSLVVSVLASLVFKPVENWAAAHWPWLAGLLVVLVLVWLIVDAEIRGRDSADDLDTATERLANSVSEEWRNEAGTRRLDPHAGLVPFRWTLTGIGGRAVTDVPSLIDAFDRAPARRLAIVGPAGSGKTSLALLLTLELVERRMARRTGPVPVKLSVANWDPREQGLMTWLKDELGTQFVFLRNVGEYGRDAPARLLERGLVLPVLDGLDELRLSGELTRAGVTVRQRGLQEIHRVLGRLPGLIVTCRADQYEETLIHGRPIPGAMRVDLRDLEHSDAAGYLSATVGAGERWELVFGALLREPDGRLARALSTPLMVALVRDVYADPRTDPAELLDSDRFPEPVDVRNHLVRGLVPAVFPELPAQDRRTDWHGTDVVRWLRFLAAGMTERNLRNISWWELPALAGRPHRVLAGLLGGLAVAVNTGLAVGSVLWLEWGPPAGLSLGGLTALAGGVWMAVPSARHLPVPSELRFGWRGKWRIMLLGGLVAALAGGAAGFLLGGADEAVLVGAVCGVPLGVVYGGAQPDATVRLASPRALLRRELGLVVMFGLAYGLTSGGVAWFLVHPLFGIGFGVSSALTGGLLYGLPWWLAVRAGRSGVVASAHLFLCTLVLASRGKAPPPWRLMKFLDEAHRRGVLRQVGPVYQFRHSCLQESLAGDDS